MHCTGYGAVREASVSSCVRLCCFVAGALRGLTRKDGSVPSLRCGPHAVAAPANLTDLLGARAERVPDCSSYLSRIPRSATDSGSSVHPRNSVDRAAVSHFQPPRARFHALLNASAASESTAAGSLKAFSQGSAGAERLENASSKFRWNPSALHPSTIAPVRGERPDVGHSSPFPKTKHARVTPGVAWPVSWLQSADARQHKPVRMHPLNHLRASK